MELKTNAIAWNPMEATIFIAANEVRGQFFISPLGANFVPMGWVEDPLFAPLFV
jgi:hypothetical protein